MRQAARVLAEKRLDKSLAERRLEKAKAELAATRAREVSTGSPEQSHGSENTAEQLVELQSSLDNERTRRKQVEVSLEQARAVNKELEERLLECSIGATAECDWVGTVAGTAGGTAMGSNSSATRLI